MKVHVHKRYVGNRAPQPIEVGVYGRGDSKLYGLAVFLRDNGNARFHEDEPVKHDVLPGEITQKVVDEILEDAKDEDEDKHGISGTRKRRKKTNGV
jgi:hypothetical protein